jgi:ABC-type nitrate/sulfonate/bicarbonate transport system substrate-binding protein
VNPQITGREGSLRRGGPAKDLEKTEVRLGFIPLTDCAPLVVALELGLFARHGLEVSLSREPSWANIRDKICFGGLDGGQMLAGMPLATTLGAESFMQPMVTGYTMSLNGNAITVSTALYERMRRADPQAMDATPLGADALRRLIEEGKVRGEHPPRFAMVFPSSTHNYLLRYWLASAGIDPDRDVTLSVIPPPQMVAHLREGLIDGYCVGEPWNTLAIEEGIGRVLISSYEIWNNHPEKVFGVTRAWAETHPNTHRAILMALIEAAIWLDVPSNREQAARLLARPEYVDTAESSLRAGLLGQFRYHRDDEVKSMPDFHVFHRYAANFPWISHAEWIISQMLRWGQLTGPIDVRHAAASVYRPDLYRQAAGALGLSCPPADQKPEGCHDQSWLLATATESFTMGPDRFFDGATFDSAEQRFFHNRRHGPRAAWKPSLSTITPGKSP